MPLFFLEHITIIKLIKLEEMVGNKQKEEKEPEGKVIAGPIGDAVEPPSAGSTPFPFSQIKLPLQSHSFISV